MLGQKCWGTVALRHNGRALLLFCKFREGVLTPDQLCAVLTIIRINQFKINFFFCWFFLWRYRTSSYSKETFHIMFSYPSVAEKAYWWRSDCISVCFTRFTTGASSPVISATSNFCPYEIDIKYLSTPKFCSNLHLWIPRCG